MREIRDIILHASLTGDEDVTVKDLDRKHRKAGWNGVGYHFVIRRSGAVETGRSIDKAGAHAKGFDKYSIGICMIGGVPAANFTPIQWKNLELLVSGLARQFPDAKVMGHRDCPRVPSDTVCPTFDVAAWWLPINV